MRKYLKLALITIIVGLVAFLLIAGLSDFENLVKSFKKIDLTFLILGIFVILLRWMVESIILVTLGKGKVLTLGRAFSTTMIGQFFNSITPFATGGQPAQVYYMSKLGLDVSDGVALLTGKFIIYQLVLTFYSLGILIFKFKEVAREVPALPFLSFVGFSLNTSIILLLILFSYKPAITRKLVGFVLKILRKFKLRVSEGTVFEKLSMFHEIMKDYISRPFLLISVFSLTFLQLLLNFSIPYFVGLSLGMKNISYSKVIAFQSILFLTLAFIPTPGTTGAAEGGFYLFFKPIFGLERIALGMIIWRFLSYYLGLILGFVFLTRFKNVGGKMEE